MAYVCPTMATTAATKAVSPGALLLRNSRLMSMPPPLPCTASQNNIWTRPGTSSTHPTVQVITTPTSSLHRGDWGLKRNLPLKVTQKYLKYHKLDTLEHRTTFESAHGEVMVLKRWQEMDIPLTMSQGRLERASVFAEIDEVHPQTGGPTNPDDPDTLLAETDFKTPPRTRPSPTKWRYRGPYMQSMNPKELATYINSKVKPRKLEFLEYVKRHQYFSSHNTLSSIPNRLPTEEELKDIKVNTSALRADPLVLQQLVISFLDLPTFSPPATHPSAGLHYIRTPSHLPNHPYMGPQEQPASFPGRQFQGRAVNVFAGVGGLVAKVVEVNAASFSGREPTNIRDNREVVRWYKPLWATVDAEGAVLLEVQSSVPPPPEYLGPGAETAKPVVEEMRERERAQMEAERVVREQWESRVMTQPRFQAPPQPSQQQQQQQYNQQQGYYDQSQQYTGYYPQETYQQQQQYPQQYPQQSPPQYQQEQYQQPQQGQYQQPQQPQQPQQEAPNNWGSILRSATRSHPIHHQHQQQQQLPQGPQNGEYAPPEHHHHQQQQPEGPKQQFANAADEVLHLLEESQAGNGWGNKGGGGNRGRGS